MKKVKIELRPYDALSILSFCREYINDTTKNDRQFAAIQEAVENYEKEVVSKLTPSQLEDAKLERIVNDLAGRHPYGGLK